MTLESKLSELNRTGQQAKLARQASDEYQESHPDETEHYYQLLGELGQTEDSQKREEIIEELSNMDGVSEADIPATWLEHSSLELKQRISRFLNREGN
jgi:hypothetical protein